jgi:hypothetical protein
MHDERRGRIMMKRSILHGGLSTIFMMLSILRSPAYGDAIYVSGEVSGTWSADSVIVTDEIYVSPGSSLAIEPGVEVLFEDQYNFRILDDAILDAVGTETEMIELGPFTDGYNIMAIEFINASDRSIVEYCRIRFAVFSAINLTNSAVTIRNCVLEYNTTSPGWGEGAAISAFYGSNALIESNTIRSNWANAVGGGIFCFASSPIIRGNLFDGNRVGPRGGANGGAIGCHNESHPLIVNNVFLNNEAYPTSTFPPSNGEGGAIYCSDGCNPTIAGNIFSNNHVQMGGWEGYFNGGGAIFADNASPCISSNLFVGNAADGDNGGALFLVNSNSNIVNNTFAGNWAADSGGAIYIISSDSVLIVNCILYGNTASCGSQVYMNSSAAEVSYCDIEGSWPGTGNMDADPVFRNQALGDYHLQDSINCRDIHWSLCIDQGSPEYIDIMLDCERGLGTEQSDMGAYGGGDSTIIGINEIAPRTPQEFYLSPNYPNPFNPTTTIQYDLPKSTDVRIEIYDILGRKVETLIHSRQKAGRHSVAWNGMGKSSGIYFYRLRAGDYTQTKKMLLLK